MKESYEYDGQEYFHSRSALKREADRLQKLGESLLDLPESTLSEIELPDNLAEAIHLAKNINSRAGFKRQRQYIGKLMRNIDPEPIEQFIEQLQQNRGEANAHHHQLEAWRDQLIDGAPNILTELVKQHPQLNVQQLRQLVRNAQKEKKESKPPKYYRDLFKYLRENTSPTSRGSEVSS